MFCWIRGKFFVLLIGIFCCLSGYAQRPNLRFNQIIEGLSFSHVKAIYQDHQGFMWFGTADGLNKYDGYTMTIYKNHPEDSLSLVGSNVSHLFEDENHVLWISTNKGVSRYNRDLDIFINQEELRGLETTTYVDRELNIWAVNLDQLYLFNKQNEKFYLYDTFPDDITEFYQDKRGTYWVVSLYDIFTYNTEKRQLIPQPHISVKSVIQIHEDSRNLLWMATMEEGLILYDRDNRKVLKYQHQKNQPNSLPKNAIHRMYEDEKGRLWIGTMNGGISIFDYDNGIFHNYSSDSGDPSSLTFNSVYSFWEDNHHKMWLGTYNSGINYVDEKRFDHYKVNLFNDNSLSNNNILFFWEDHDANIWIGTDGGGLNIFDRKNNHFNHVRYDPNDPYSMGSDIVIRIVEDKQGNIWLGHWEGGISLYDKEKHRFINYKYSDHNDSAIWMDDCIIHMYNDSKDNLWVATVKELTLFDKKQKKFIPYHIPNGAMKNYVGSMLEDDDSNLWVGTWDGLNLMNRETGEIINYSHNSSDPQSISNNQIYMMMMDSKNRIWIGTADGLNLFDPKTRKFKSFHVKDGLPSAAIYSMVEDENGYLWLGTSHGLSKFDYENVTFRNYDTFDGLQGNEFKNHACIGLSTGELIFGGAKGFNLFDPSDIMYNQFVPPVVITDFKIFNQPLPIGTADSPLQKHISQTKELKIDYEYSVLTFEFAALNYQSPAKNQYAYYMEGFDKDWIYSGAKRNATYTNLNPGTYTFRVKASNNDGVWNETGTALTIKILPAYYQTLWFRLLVILTTTIIIYFLIKGIISKQQQRKLEMLVRNRTEELSIQTENLQKANFEIKEQGKKIEMLFKDMKDSIKAAKVIHQSVLPSRSYIHKYFEDAFILDKPKDVVSGDFYWIDQVDDKIIVAVVDCTGHGVSGAFMSIISNHLINQSVANVDCLNAAQILDRLNYNLVKELNQLEKEASLSNGMDIALCIIDRTNMKLNFAGANSPLYYVREQQVHKIPANPFPIGLYYKKTLQQFHDHEIDIQKGDMIYLFSDGYADQIGGPGGYDKFMYHRFRNMLLQISDKDGSLQLKELDQTLTHWQSHQEQLDDIMIVGFRV